MKSNPRTPFLRATVTGLTPGRARPLVLGVGQRSLRRRRGERLEADDDDARQIEHRPAAVAHVRVARDGEEPGGEARVLAQGGRRLRELHPGLLREVLGGVPPPRQAEEEAEHARVERRVGPVERGDVAAPEPVHERPLVQHSPSKR